MAEQDRAGEADRFAQGTGHTEKHEAERDGFRPGESGGGQANAAGTANAAAQGAGPQSIEATTSALGDMEPSAGSGGAGRAETDKETDV
ncbi:MAG: hypothetical protein JOZ02_06960 [Acidobacteria bacterium]|nr:hypothetical protein [Acidobacteriota bacterium]